MSKWDGLNRRRFPRVIYPCLVVIQSDEGGAKDIILTHTENVGIGGVCLILKQDIKMFTTVELELDLLDLGNHIKCQGKVVWNVQRKTEAKNKPMFYDIGIEFADVTDEEQHRLEKIIQRLVKNSEETTSP